MAIVGVLTYIGLTLMGVPLPFLLAAIAFITELLPIVGPWLGFIPALIIAATEGWQTALMVTVFYLILQQLESNVILPMVQRHQTELPALVILAAVLIGGAAMGVLGALVALPIAIVMQTLVTDLLIPWRRRANGEEEEPARERLRPRLRIPGRDARRRKRVEGSLVTARIEREQTP